MTDYAKVIELYNTAWNETDENQRLELLRRCWGEHGQYTAPDTSTHGLQGISQAIQEFHQAQPGARLDTVSGVDEHHGQVRFCWTLFGPDGEAVMPGMSAGLIEDGRIQRMTGFFGPFPEPATG